MTEPQLNALINQTINQLETITYYKHHYVRKAGLKKTIKELVRQVNKEVPANPGSRARVFV